MRLAFLLYLILIPDYSFCQINHLAGLTFRSTGTGRNIAATYQLQWRKHNIHLDLKWHINRKPVDNQDHVFFKRFYASTFSEHIGFAAGYYYQLFRDRKTINPLLFLDAQYLRAPIMRYGFTRQLIPGGGSKGLVFHDELSKPMIAIENSIGIGFTAILGDRMYLIEKLGVSHHLFTALDRSLFHFSDVETQFGYLISMSLLYDI